MGDVAKQDGWEDPKLLESVTKDLEAFNKAIDDEEAPVEEKPTPEPTGKEPAADDKSTPEVKDKPAEEPKADDAPADEKPATPAKAGEEPAGEPDDDRPPIPDGHYRAALHMMSVEEISALYDADPKLALKVLAKCHDIENATSRQLGELGQAMRKAREIPAAPAPGVTPASSQPSRKEAVRAMLKKDYDDSPALEALLELIPDAPTPVAAQPVAPVAQVQQESMDEVMAKRQQIVGFFADPDMEVFGDFYGAAKGPDGSWDHLTPGQKANRLAVLDRAQLILDGAQSAGAKITTAEALERAHLEVSAPITETIVRQRIVASVSKRAKGVTLKPSAGKTPAPVKAGEYDQKGHIQEVAAALKEVFGK